MLHANNAQNIETNAISLSFSIVNCSLKRSEIADCNFILSEKIGLDGTIILLLKGNILLQMIPLLYKIFHGYCRGLKED